MAKKKHDGECVCGEDDVMFLHCGDCLEKNEESGLFEIMIDKKHLKLVAGCINCGKVQLVLDVPKSFANKKCSCCELEKEKKRLEEKFNEEEK